MPTKKKTAKPTKKKPVKNGHKKNGAFKDPNLISEWLARTPNVVVASGTPMPATGLVGPPPVPQVSNYRDIVNQLAYEVTEFRDAMLAKYTNYEGHDLRKNLAWYMEQYGNGILSEMEREKRKERDRIIAENRAKEEAEREAQEVAPK